MASHWGVNDQVNGTMSRFWGAFLMPLMSLAMLGLFLLIPAIDPLKANIAQFRGPFNLFIVLMIVFLTYVHGLTIAWNLGYTGFQMSTALLPAMGLLFIFVGYMLAKAKRNFFIGIRTPWTLSSDTVWDKTHALGSKLFIASGHPCLHRRLLRRYDRLLVPVHPADGVGALPGGLFVRPLCGRDQTVILGVLPPLWITFQPLPFTFHVKQETQ